MRQEGKEKREREIYGEREKTGRESEGKTTFSERGCQAACSKRNLSSAKASIISTGTYHQVWPESRAIDRGPKCEEWRR